MKGAKWSDVEHLLTTFTKAMAKISKSLELTGTYSRLENTVPCKCLELGHVGLLYKPPQQFPNESSEEIKGRSSPNPSSPSSRHATRSRQPHLGV
mmetsp:Transcript_20515/g.50345  ORF Transcript_20515/g.50345 Transcript_20515/m.50345 type:complete len:95 (+) Transcript_20515:1147-1431(+)